jgi:protease-4
MDRRSVIVLGVIFGGLFLSLFAFVLLAMVAVRSDDDGGGFGGGDHIAVVEVKGPIASADKLLKYLRKIARDEHARAVLVRIDSPGGAVAPSQEIRSELRKLGETKKVVCTLGNLAASGGYYVATGCQTIVANPGTLTGSIGVLSQLPYVGAIAEMLKFQLVTIKAGKMKDVGNPFRPMSEEERAYFQALSDGIHRQFIEAVAEGRGMKVEEVEPLADGRVFSGLEAKEKKLVDELGSFNDAVRLAAALAGIEGEPKLRYPPEERSFRFEDLVRDGSRAATRGVLDALGAAAERPPPSLHASLQEP